jgi:hypothetical protein
MGIRSEAWLDDQGHTVGADLPCRIVGKPSVGQGEAGLVALNREISVLKEQLEDYGRRGEFEGERDEDGNVIWERGDILACEIAFACDALMELRKVFAIGAFHTWERSAQRWVAQDSNAGEGDGSRDHGLPDFAALTKAMGRLGYPVHANLVRVQQFKHAQAQYRTSRSGAAGVVAEYFPARVSEAIWTI